MVGKDLISAERYRENSSSILRAFKGQEKTLFFFSLFLFAHPSSSILFPPFSRSIFLSIFELLSLNWSPVVTGLKGRDPLQKVHNNTNNIMVFVSVLCLSWYLLVILYFFTFEFRLSIFWSKLCSLIISGPGLTFLV